MTPCWIPILPASPARWMTAANQGAWVDEHINLICSTITAIVPMHIISMRTLREFWHRHPAAESPLRHRERGNR